MAAPALPGRPNHSQGCTQRPDEPFLEQREGFLFPAIASTHDSLSKKATIPRPLWGVTIE